MRTVDATSALVVTLKRHLTWLKAEKLREGAGEPEWLFSKADGTLMGGRQAQSSRVPAAYGHVFARGEKLQLLAESGR